MLHTLWNDSPPYSSDSWVVVECEEGGGKGRVPTQIRLPHSQAISPDGFSEMWKCKVRKVNVESESCWVLWWWCGDVIGLDPPLAWGYHHTWTIPVWIDHLFYMSRLGLVQFSFNELVSEKLSIVHLGSSKRRDTDQWDQTAVVNKCRGSRRAKTIEDCRKLQRWAGEIATVSRWP